MVGDFASITDKMVTATEVVGIFAADTIAMSNILRMAEQNYSRFCGTARGDIFLPDKLPI